MAKANVYFSPEPKGVCVMGAIGTNGRPNCCGPRYKFRGTSSMEGGWSCANHLEIYLIRKQTTLAKSEKKPIPQWLKTKMVKQLQSQVNRAQRLAAEDQPKGWKKVK